VAIGSGIFRTPGDVAVGLQRPSWIILAWILGGVVVLMQGMVTAELATRFPKAGGEYVFLREAYGEFVAFFFGWAYTVFIIGGGAATIAAAFGEFACDLFAVSIKWSGPLAAVAIVLVTGVNAAGLRAGAGTQNVLTCLKILALLGVALVGFVYGRQPVPMALEPVGAEVVPTAALFIGAMLPILWSYNGTTDSVKMAEEIKDVRRALPLAIISSSAALIVIYVVFNVALMRVLPPTEMAGLASVPGEAMSRLFGPTGRGVLLVTAMLVCLSSLSSTVLATIRVTFALARDGLTFSFMSRMSKRQAPVPALVVVGGFSIVLVMNRNFREVLQIYFLASAVLFGLSYASLIVFRYRDRGFAPQVFRCPLGIAQAVVLILIQLAVAVTIVLNSPGDAVYTALLLAFFGLLYFVWQRTVRHR
jgi:APA family basic amino acid/polyamine antiporter